MGFYTDLGEIKAILEIDPNNTAEDKKLNFCNEWATNWISEWLNHDLSYKVRTQYYNGTGTQKLLLRNRPVYPSTQPSFAQTVPFSAINVLQDENGFYGAVSGSFDSNTAQLTYGTDYSLVLDTDTDNDGIDEASRSAILIRIGNYWNKPNVRQRGYLSPFIGQDFGSYKVTYTAGYTADTLPATLRMAVDLLISRLRYVLPLGLELASESYEDRSIAMAGQHKNYMFSLVAPMLINYRNWKWK